MAEIQQDVANNHVGGSNIELEEKAINMLATMLGLAPTVIFEPTQKLWEWCDNFTKNHSNFDNIVLSSSEIDSWFEAVEAFQTYYINHPDESGPLYDKPIDYNLLPYALLNLLKKSNCNK